MEEIITLTVKMPKADVEKIDALANKKSKESPDGVKTTRSHLTRKWILEGLKKTAATEVPA